MANLPPNPGSSDTNASPSARSGALVSRRRFSAAVAGTLLTGCTPWRQYVGNRFKVGPNYAKPAAAVASEWIDNADARVKAGTTDLRDWWQVFNDPYMDQLVRRAYDGNLTLRVAGLRVVESQAQLGVAVGGIFPQTQNVNATYLRNQISHANPSTSFFPFRAINSYNVGATLAWELDFWGRFRRAIESADATLDASVENYDDALVMLLSDTCDAYVQYRTAQQRLKYAQENVAIQTGVLGIAEDRFKAGVANELDVTQARSNLSRTEALIPQFQLNKRVQGNRLCILMGIPPRELDSLLGEETPIPSAPPEVVLDVPAELLLRRPDVRRAERLVAAQSAQIGIAVSDLYPHMSITGNLNVNSQLPNLLFTGSAVAGNVGPTFNWSILNYGRFRNNIRYQDARFQELAVEYQQVVLKANADAENALNTFLRAQEQVRVLQVSVQAAKRSVEIVTEQYKAGTADFNRVFNIQALLTQEQDGLAQAQSAVALGLVLLYRNLGGGWQLRLEEPRPNTTVDALPVNESQSTPPPPPPPSDAKPINEEASRVKPVVYLEDKLPSAPPPPVLQNFSLHLDPPEKK